jgi:hypothetical protein
MFQERRRARKLMPIRNKLRCWRRLVILLFVMNIGSINFLNMYTTLAYFYYFSVELDLKRKRTIMSKFQSLVEKNHLVVYFYFFNLNYSGGFSM